MAEHPGSYDHFVEWCRAQRDPLGLKAVEIATNQDETNRTGHIMRGALASIQFLRQKPEMLEWLAASPRTVNNPVDTSDETFLEAWQDFLRGNSIQHRILQHILPRRLGGATVGGGGGAYPFKVALRLAADYLSETKTEIETTEIPVKYRMVRRKEFDRDHPAVLDLKARYDHACQICGLRIHLGGKRYYCEGHHLRPLGRSHGGRADTSNVIIVCPNHHAEFDHFLFAILDMKGRRRRLEHMYRDLAPSEQHITVRHKIAAENLDYVIEQFLTRMDLYFTK